MGSQNHINGDRSRTNWTPVMERFFIDVMLDQVQKGNRMGHTFNKQAWNDMMIVFNEKFGSPYDVNVLKSRYTNLWKQFNDIKILLDQNGFSWDDTRKMVVAEKYAWDAYIKAHPDAQSYRNKALTNFNDLCLIYAHTTADGRYSLSSHDLLSNDLDFDDDIQPMNVAVGANCGPTTTKEQPKTDWTLSMDRYFMTLMLDQLKKGNKINNTFTRQAWKDMPILFNAKFGTQYGQKTLKLHHKKLFKYYSNLRSLLGEKGFFWDEKDEWIVADDVVWDNYIMAHPDARCYRNQSLLNYHDLDLIYGNEITNGFHQQLHRRKFFEDAILQCNAGEEKKTDSFVCDGHLAREDPDSEDPDLLFDEEEIQSDVHGDCSSIEWTASMDRCLIDIMLEQVKRMSKIDKTDDQAWIDMVALFKDRFGLHHGKDVLQSQSKRLEKQYRDMKDLLSQRGFWWDEMQQMVKASDDVWDAYIEEHPGAESYRIHSKPNYNDLCLIYGKSTANGRGGQYASYNGSGPKLINGYRWRTDWTPQMDRYFINLMLEQVRNGSMFCHKFGKLAWTDMVAKFSADFGSQYDKEVLKSRFLNLRKRFNDMKALVDQSGFAWDEMQQKIIADDDLWDACVREYPDARSYRNRTLPNINDLYLIFGNANTIEKHSYSSCSMDAEDGDPEVNIGEEDDQSPPNIYPREPIEDPDVIPYGDGLVDRYDDLFDSFSLEVPNGRSNFCIERETEVNNKLQMGMDDIFCNLKSPAREFEISDQRKKRKTTGSLKPASSRKVQTKIEETEGFEEKPCLLNSLTCSEEDNGYCSIERVVGALQTVPDLTDELFLEACEFLEDERKANMFVAMDVTARRKWLLRKLRR